MFAPLFAFRLGPLAVGVMLLALSACSSERATIVIADPDAPSLTDSATPTPVVVETATAVVPTATVPAAVLPSPTAADSVTATAVPSSTPGIETIAAGSAPDDGRPVPLHASFPAGFTQPDLSDPGLELFMEPARILGSTERDGRIFFGQGPSATPQFPQPSPERGCAEKKSTVVFSLAGNGADPEVAGAVPGIAVNQVFVDFTGQATVISTCWGVPILTVGQLSNGVFETRGSSSWVKWPDGDEGANRWPRREGVTTIRWGDWLLDLSSDQWFEQPLGDGEVRVLGESDSGRFRYWTETGPMWTGDDGACVVVDCPHEDARLLVTDTATGEVREATGSNLGIDAWQLLFGPDDEVAWMTGTELGTAALFGRVDWTTGQFVDVRSILDYPDSPYWGHPWSGSGSPGPDAITFEADGTLRAWAYTVDRAVGGDPSTWRLETLTFAVDTVDGPVGGSVDDLAGG